MNKDIMRAAGLGDYVDKVERGTCPYCNKPIHLEAFVDKLSLKEFEISGMCQSCQDSYFDENDIASNIRPNKFGVDEYPLN